MRESRQISAPARQLGPTLRAAKATSSERRDTPALAVRLATWRSTVRDERYKRAPMSLVDSPSASRRRTSSSRAVSPNARSDAEDANSSALRLGTGAPALRSSDRQADASRSSPLRSKNRRASVSQATGSPHPSAKAASATRR